MDDEIKSREAINNVILKQSDEHSIILKYISGVEGLLRDKKYHAFIAKVTYFAESMKQDLAEHFRREEEIFFPALLLAKPDPEIVQTVLMLQKQHGILEQTIQTVSKHAHTPVKERPDEQNQIIQLYKQFILEMKDHAGIEVKILFPAIHASEDAMHLVRKLSDNS